jgi:integrase
MPYQYVREPITAEESDRLSNACETPTERLVVWTLLVTGLRVSELCDLTSKNVLWQRQLRIKDKGGPCGTAEGASHFPVLLGPRPQRRGWGCSRNSGAGAGAGLASRPRHPRLPRGKGVSTRKKSFRTIWRSVQS